MTIPESKTCALCGETKPLGEYYRCSREKDGRMWRCKVCVKRKQREANIDKDRKKQTAAAYWQRYYAENGERLREKRREYVAEFPERKRAARKPHLMRRDSQRRRARVRNAYIEDVPFDFILQRDQGVCGICRLPVMEATVEMDHIIPLAAGGRHERTNVQLAHRSCNRKKSDKLEGQTYLAL